jgi:hypothetical protein
VPVANFSRFSGVSRGWVVDVRPDNTFSPSGSQNAETIVVALANSEFILTSKARFSDEKLCVGDAVAVYRGSKGDVRFGIK